MQPESYTLVLHVFLVIMSKELHAISLLFTATHSSMSAWPIGPPSRMCLAPSCVYSMAEPTRTASPPLDPLRTIIEPLTDSTRFLFTLPSFIIILLSDQWRQQSQHKQLSALMYCMVLMHFSFALHFDTSSFLIIKTVKITLKVNCKFLIID